MRAVTANLVLVIVTLLASGSANSNDGDLSYSDAFTKLKMLEGKWDEAEYGRVIEYRLTGKGSALIEEFVGDPPMTSVYHMDGEDLRLTHYCNAGNQPRMIAADYDADSLHFDFTGVSNLKAPDAYHTRTLSIEFIDEHHVVLQFTGRKEGRKIVTTHTLTRRD